MLGSPNECFQSKKKLDCVKFYAKVLTDPSNYCSSNVHSYMVIQSTADFLLWRTLPVLQLIEASVGWSPNTGALLSPLPFH